MRWFRRWLDILENRRRSANRNRLITADLLLEYGACAGDVDKFRDKWPDGVQPCLEALVMAADAGMDLQWFAHSKLLTHRQRLMLVRSYELLRSAELDMRVAEHNAAGAVAPVYLVDLSPVMKRVYADEIWGVMCQYPDCDDCMV